MQTFLPFASFSRSAAALDDRRLGKQRVEVLQILRALHLDDYGWAHHPAVLMWRGCTRALVAYGLAMVDQWCEYGHADTTRPLITEFARPRDPLPAARLPAEEIPPWLGLSALHCSHQAALVRKDPAVYGAVFPGVSPDQPYVWPDPPAGPPPEQPFTAWVVRSPSQEVVQAFRSRRWIGVPVAFAGREATRKQRRQHARFRDVLEVGDPVVLAAGNDLHCAVVDGPATQRATSGVPYLARRVIWGRTVARTSLLRPYQLQDPQLLFTLRGEAHTVCSV